MDLPTTTATIILPSPSTSAGTSTTGNNQVPVIAGIVVGAITGLALICAILAVLWHRRTIRRRRKQEEADQFYSKQYLISEYGHGPSPPQLPPLLTDDRPFTGPICPSTTNTNIDIEANQPLAPSQQSRASLDVTSVYSQESAPPVRTVPVPITRESLPSYVLRAAPSVSSLQRTPPRSEYIVSPITSSEPATRSSSLNRSSTPTREQSQWDVNDIQLSGTKVLSSTLRPQFSMPYANSFSSATTVRYAPQTQTADPYEFSDDTYSPLDEPQPLFARAPTPPPKSPLRAEREKIRNELRRASVLVESSSSSNLSNASTLGRETSRQRGEVVEAGPTAESEDLSSPLESGVSEIDIAQITRRHRDSRELQREKRDSGLELGEDGDLGCDHLGEMRGLLSYNARARQASVDSHYTISGGDAMQDVPLSVEVLSTKRNSVEEVTVSVREAVKGQLRMAPPLGKRNSVPIVRKPVPRLARGLTYRP